MVKIDKKDKRILAALEHNPIQPVSQIANEAGVSRQVADYRINKLIDQGTIYDFHTIPDIYQFGYVYFRAHLRLKDIGEDEYEALADDLFSNYPTFWVAYVAGSFDLVIGMYAQDPHDFESRFNDFLAEYNDVVQSHEQLLNKGVTLCTYDYFTDDKAEKTITLHDECQNKSIDHTDQAILRLIKQQARMPYREIGRQVDLSRPAVKNRIERLTEQNIIRGHKMFVDFDHFNKESFKIFVQYDHAHLDQEEGFLAYLHRQPGVLATVRFLGKWDLDIEIHKDDMSRLQRFIIQLRNRFDIIEDYEIIQILRDYGIDFFPDKLNVGEA